MSSAQDQANRGYGSIPEIRHDADSEKARQSEQQRQQEKERLLRQDQPTESSSSLCGGWTTNRTLLALGGGAMLVALYLMSSSSSGEHHQHEEHELPPPLPNTDNNENHVDRSNDREMYFDDQVVDHFNDSDHRRYSQRYFDDPTFFGGPGYPIFVIMGGEEPCEEMMYPYISQHVGKRYQAYTMTVEHRFYGKSLPVRSSATVEDVSPQTNKDFHTLFTPHQALKDAVRLIQHKREEFGCGPKGSDTYCPVLSVGGSYPGFLSSLMRIHYPDVVDMGYGSSAPLRMYNHDASQFVYFEKITSVADEESPGCANAVRTALLEVQDHFKSLKDKKGDETDALDKIEAGKTGVCVDTIPEYMTTNTLFQQELMMTIAERFANNNMEYYPPSPEQKFVKGCKIFQDDKLTSLEKVTQLLRLDINYPKEQCFDLMTDLPPGPGGTISGSDWSGVGGLHEGWMWDFHACVLVTECGFSSGSMFPERKFTLSWLTKHCQDRFQYTPNLDLLSDTYHLHDLSNVTKLLFVNGLKDGWSAMSYADPEDVRISKGRVTVYLNDGEQVRKIGTDEYNEEYEKAGGGIVILNLQDGSHHSELTPMDPYQLDTPDVKAGHLFIGNLIGTWLEEVKYSQGM